MRFSSVCAKHGPHVSISQGVPSFSYIQTDRVYFTDDRVRHDSTDVVINVRFRGSFLIIENLIGVLLTANGYCCLRTIGLYLKLSIDTYLYRPSFLYRISNLPDSWKEELHPKLLEHKSVRSLHYFFKHFFLVLYACSLCF